MQDTAITTHPARAGMAMTALDRSRGRSVARVAAIVTAAAVVALLIASIVAASLGLGADGHPRVGPDRPPAPDLFRVTASGPTLPREAVVWKDGPS
jgi:hypothetical protein